jgi:lipoate-protein ligase A
MEKEMKRMEKGIALVDSPLGAPKGFFFSFPKECPPEKIAEVISAMEKLIQEHFQDAEDEAYVVDKEMLEIKEQLSARWT